MRARSRQGANPFALPVSILLQRAGLISPWVIGIATDSSDSGRQNLSGLTVNGWENDCIRQLMAISGVQVWRGLEHVSEILQRTCYNGLLF